MIFSNSYARWGFILLALALFSLWGCSSDPTCSEACENLADCGKISGSKSDCVDACSEDPSVMDQDLRCFAGSSCSDMGACFPKNVNPLACWSMCKKIYQECNSLIQVEGGELSEEQCATMCRESLSREKVSCARQATCSQLSTCL